MALACRNRRRLSVLSMQLPPDDDSNSIELESLPKHSRPRPPQTQLGNEKNIASRFKVAPASRRPDRRAKARQPHERSATIPPPPRASGPPSHADQTGSAMLFDTPPDSVDDSRLAPGTSHPQHAVHSASTGIVPSHFVTRRNGFFITQVSYNPTPCATWFLRVLRGIPLRTLRSRTFSQRPLAQSTAAASCILYVPKATASRKGRP